MNAKDIIKQVTLPLKYCKVKMLVDNKIASRNTASKYLNRLADLGILEPMQEGKEILYLNRGLYEILAQN